VNEWALSYRRRAAAEHKDEVKKVAFSGGRGSGYHGDGIGNMCVDNLSITVTWSWKSRNKTWLVKRTSSAQKNSTHAVIGVL